jgi:6-phosphogluconolactonase/glucosamine-6-phosphate isomerase/deaminase
MLHGDVTPELPASALRQHANALVLLDREAAIEIDEGVAAGS